MKDKMNKPKYIPKPPRSCIVKVLEATRMERKLAVRGMLESGVSRGVLVIGVAVAESPGEK